MAASDLEILFRINERNQRAGGYFEFSDPKPSSSKDKPSTPEQNTIELELVSSTEKRDVAKSSLNSPIVDFKDYDIAEKTIHYIKTNRVINKPKTKSAEVEENLKKTEFI